jgi:membrane protein
MERDTDLIASAETANEPGRGRHATEPTEIPPRGWKDILTRVRVEAKRDRVAMLSSAVAFHALLALAPALVALVSLYGLIADPSSIDRQVNDWLGTAPREVRELLSSQLKSITENAGAAAGLAVVIGIVVALWSASSGIAHLIEATNIAYDEEETRGFVARRVLALILTLGAVVFILVALVLVTVLPAALADTGLGLLGRMLVGILRWVLLIVGMMLALSVLYRYAPDRDRPQWTWTSPGALLATLLWVIASAGFALYTANFGKYNETYGALGAVVVLMLWLFFTALCVIVGAELNAEVERQTRQDTTQGAPLPLGSRDAEVADTVGATAEELRDSVKTGPENSRQG